MLKKKKKKFTEKFQVVFNLWFTKQKHRVYLEFFMVEGFEEVLRNELSKSLLQGQKLGLDTTHKPPVHIKPGTEKRTW